jgi:hypothetical protein
MKLDVIIDDKTHRIEIPPGMLEEAEDFFRKMDRDMDQGWQMGPEFVENPSSAQRCQIAANKLLTSHTAQNLLVMQLMAAYILARQPGVQTVNIDTTGEMLGTELIFESGARRATRAGPAGILSEAEARARADKDVSPVYKVGRSWRFAVYDPGADRWLESPFTDSEDEAKRQRDQAHARLIQSLIGRDAV